MIIDPQKEGMYGEQHLLLRIIKSWKYTYTRMGWAWVLKGHERKTTLFSALHRTLE